MNVTIHWNEFLRVLGTFAVMGLSNWLVFKIGRWVGYNEARQEMNFEFDKKTEDETIC